MKTTDAKLQIINQSIAEFANAFIVKMKAEVRIPNDQVEWSRAVFTILEDGGKWGVPRSGIILQKNRDRLIMIGRMVEHERICIERTPNDIKHRFKDNTEDITIDNSGFLTAEQRAEYQSLKLVFSKAGIEVEDQTGEIPYIRAEHGAFTYGINKVIDGHIVITKQLGVTFDLRQAIEAIILSGFDLTGMNLVAATRPASPIGTA